MGLDLFELSATLNLDTSGFSGGITGAMNMITGLTDFAEKKFAWLANTALDFGKDVFQTGMGFDQAMANVRAVLGSTEGTIENMNELRAYALDLAKDSVFTAEDTADAYYYMGMAGWKAEQMQRGLPGIIALAAASGEDLARVSDIVTDSITAFGLSADDVTKYVDILAQTATNANTDVSRMGETFKYVAPVAGALGYNVEDVAITIGLLADAGIKGSMAGTTLRNIFTRIATNAGSTAKDLGALEIMTDKLGVSFYDAEDKVRPWLEVLTEARKSWQGLSENEMQELAAAFGSIGAEAADSSTLVAQFNEDAKAIKDTINSLNSRDKKDVEGREEDTRKLDEYYRTYKGLLEALGVSIKDIESGHLTLSDAFDQARIKLGGLTDQEAIYFAKQIASMRGMSGWLTLMNMSDEEAQKLTKSIQNATGAAQGMADTRLDSLSGEVTKLTSAFDILKITVYDEAKGPMREIVHWITEAIKDITEALNENGLLGGVEMLGTKIEEAGDNFRPMLESIGKAAAPVLTTVFEETLPALDDTIVSLGHSLGGGLFTGLSDSLQEKYPLLAGLAGTLGYGLSTDTRHGVGSLTSGDMNPLKVQEVHAETITFGEVELTEQQLRDALDNATHNWFWGDQVILAGEKVSADIAQNLLDQLTKAGEQGGKQMMDNVAEEVAKSVDNGVGKPTRSAIANAGLDGGADMTANITDQVNASAPGIGDILSFFVGDGGAVAGAVFSTLFGNELGAESWNISDSLANTLGSAGNGAGWDIASGIQSALNLSHFTVGITGVISNVINKVKNVFGFNASAMSSGRIYTKPTVFGYYDNAYQVAGDAGPEAVVGVNSLQRMITSAVHGAGGQEIVVPRNESRQLTVILELDRQQMGKAVYKLNNEETQRVGVRLAKGGTY